MADITSIDRRGSKIITPGSGYDTKDLPPAVMTRDQAVDAELGILRGQVRQLRSVIDGMRGTINVHHQAMTELTLLAQSLEDRTLRGRIRRARAWVLGVAIECGLRSPLPAPVVGVDLAAGSDTSVEVVRQGSEIVSVRELAP